MPKENYWAHAKNRNYYGFQSEYADNFLNKTNKIIKKKYFYYYLKNFNFYPYIQSAYLQLMNKIFKNLFSHLISTDLIKNFKEITIIAQKNHQQIINLGKF